ncbi:hypothetical protein EST38_g6531 [Candolleomyces aberdarensis]|uniref:Helitron helicase-like domain-containing protein n=1 Tax=Candolleomyces aberdarensis TaxID=2316362 RepID=A0A4Q2DKD8_9AGAR|nr:hypothetical protein EST38_g6531 [Candolleomyces aberdarensis]
MDDECFEEDNEFAFLFYNIIRKKNVSHGLRFSTSARRYKQTVDDLLSIDQVRLFHLAEKLRGDQMYRPTNDDDLRILETLKSINLLAREVPGSAAQKLKMRNEIRSMMISLGAPTLFVTLNPSDKDNPLVQIYADTEHDVESILRGGELSDWERRVLASKKPVACAKFFDAVVKAFINTVLRCGKPDTGLYGKCIGYYGAVEAQGRGTLHCHMLVWLHGHPPPRALRQRLQQSAMYREKLALWLESIMQGDFVGGQRGRQEVKSAWSKRLEREITGGGSVHPGAVAGPSLKEMSHSEFWEEFEYHTNRLLVEYNIHEHTSTCWKYLARGEAKTPENCRMGITGQMHEKTYFDDETMRVTVKKTHPKMTYFTPLVLFLLKCNMDIKFVGAGVDANAFMFYVTDYITKSAMALHVGLAALAYAIKRIEADSREGGLDSSPEGGVLRSFMIAVNSMVGHQEISHQQVMSYLVGGGDHYTNGSFRTFNWGELLRYIQGRCDALDSPDREVSPLGEMSNVTLIEKT